MCRFDMKKPNEKQVKAWFVIELPGDKLYSIHLQRDAARAQKYANDTTFQSYVIPCTIIYTLPTK
jgi:hypothetical protein